MTSKAVRMAIHLEVGEGVALVRIDRPDKLNAFTLAMFEELGRVFLRCRDDVAVRVVVVTGTGERAFSAGADLTESIPALADGRFDISRWDDAFLKRGDFFKPVVSAVNGLCLGGGFELVLATDLRVAADDAVFAFPEPTMGFVPAAGTLARLVRQVPYAQAMELMLTANRFSAQRLHAMGLLNAVVPRAQLMATAMDYACRLASMPPLAIRTIKQAALTLPDLPLVDAFAAEARLSQRAFGSAETKAKLREFGPRR
jgi:enoyl-CoA hydratase/carnithine racemase